MRSKILNSWQLDDKDFFEAILSMYYIEMVMDETCYGSFKKVDSIVRDLVGITNNTIVVFPRISEETKEERIIIMEIDRLDDGKVFRVIKLEEDKDGEFYCVYKEVLDDD